MFIKKHTVLGINPGATYIGLAVLHGTELQEWQVKIVKGQWSPEKIERHLAIIRECIARYEPNAVAIKALHPARSSKQLNDLVARIITQCKRKRIPCHRYSIKGLRDWFAIEGNVTNKRELIEMVAGRYPVLFHALYREKSRRNPYHIRMFEAVALATVCADQMYPNNAAERTTE